MSDSRLPRDRRRLTATVTDLAVDVQRAFLVGVELAGDDRSQELASLDELGLLTDTAGSDVVGSELVKRQAFDPATLIGSGKADEIADLVRALDVDVVVVDRALSPAQQRNLQARFGVDVVDREALILDIFAQHARSRVGSVQVELALLRYRLPRLRGLGKTLSQQGAGIGTRGPGETKLETDRRRILQRISRLEKDLADSARHLETQRKQRRASSLPQVAIVGYTNAGKSTLLNALTDSDALVEDRLFATLDPTVRRLDAAPGVTLLLADTVGFVRRLPHGLVEAFRSTLAEAAESDLLVHLVDGTEEDPTPHIEAVDRVLHDIGAGEVPRLMAFNKADGMSSAQSRRLRASHPDAVHVSALRETGLDSLKQAMAEAVTRTRVTLSLAIPYERGDVAAAAHRLGEVLGEKHDDSGTVMDVTVPAGEAERFTEFLRA